MQRDDRVNVDAERVDTGALELAQQMMRIAEHFAEQNTAGNGEIIFKVTVTGGKISRFLNFAGKWFPRKPNRER